MQSRQSLRECQRIVIKVGTSTITYGNGNMNLSRMEKLARELSDLHNEGREILLVSSGAVAAGVTRLGKRDYPKTIPLKQAMAAVGQGTLLHLYDKFFAEYGKYIAQVLLTKDDFDERLRYLNACNTLTTLLQIGAIPLINENDTVVVEEIKFGDNDTLSALVAEIVDADLLIILTDIDGLYDEDPRTNPEATLYQELEKMPKMMEKDLRGRGNKFSSGGMYTKLLAARTAMSSGIPMVVANGSEAGVVRSIIEGERVGTLFKPRESKMQARKRWIAFGSQSHGALLIDAGAVEALQKKGKSLLPSGVVEIQGEFERGNVVSVQTIEGMEIGRGMVNYSSNEISSIMGRKTSEITKILGTKDYDEIIHRNNLTLIQP
ncbi:MAG: glutamate 5-kinase [Syntrophomonadaceae bacterium]|nr:glutamate 5-kinase [Syntrophomonadaceae bacterium]